MANTPYKTTDFFKHFNQFKKGIEDDKRFKHFRLIGEDMVLELTPLHKDEVYGFLDDANTHGYLRQTDGDMWWKFTEKGLDYDPHEKIKTRFEKFSWAVVSSLISIAITALILG